MKYSDLTEEKKKKLSSYLVAQASKQSEVGRQVFDNVSKYVLLANTGGIAISSSLLASGYFLAGGLYGKLSILLFSISVCAFIVLKFKLAINIGSSVKRVKDFQVNIIRNHESVADENIRNKMAGFANGLDGNEPIRTLGISILLFIIGMIMGLIGLFF